MKAILPNAIFIGFTGTPLLKKDKATSKEVFGQYIHTYKYTEAIQDKVVLDLIVTSGVDKAINDLPSSLKNNPDAVIEIITNNTRKKIITERANNPEFYNRMSEILDEIIKDRKNKALEYEVFLKKIVHLVKDIQRGHEDHLPKELDSHGKKVLYENLNKDLKLTIKVHEAIKDNAPDGWKEGHQAKEQIVKKAIYDIIPDREEVERIFQIIYQQKEY